MLIVIRREAVLSVVYSRNRATLDQMAEVEQHRDALERETTTLYTELSQMRQQLARVEVMHQLQQSALRSELGADVAAKVQELAAEQERVGSLQLQVVELREIILQQREEITRLKEKSRRFRV